MSFIEEILEVEKDSENRLEKAREGGEKTLEEAEVQKKKELASILVRFQEKKSKALELQNKELEIGQNKSQQNLEKELEEIREKSSSKRSGAVDFVISQIL